MGVIVLRAVLAERDGCDCVTCGAGGMGWV